VINLHLSKIIGSSGKPLLCPDMIKYHLMALVSIKNGHKACQGEVNLHQTVMQLEVLS
jgi:hypothetical protein